MYFCNINLLHAVWFLCDYSRFMFSSSDGTVIKPFFLRSFSHFLFFDIITSFGVMCMCSLATRTGAILFSIYV